MNWERKQTVKQSFMHDFYVSNRRGHRGCFGWFRWRCFGSFVPYVISLVALEFTVWFEIGNSKPVEKRGCTTKPTWSSPVLVLAGFEARFASIRNLVVDNAFNMHSHSVCAVTCLRCCGGGGGGGEGCFRLVKELWAVGIESIAKSFWGSAVLRHCFC